MTQRLVQAAVYRRSVHASLARVWENVRDWEHLPWLHAGTFAAIDCHDSGDWGWRARVALQPAAAENTLEIELVIDEPRSRYVTRTLKGIGQGTEIHTLLDATSGTSTDIEVQFHLPASFGGEASAAGQGYVALYTRLWDEDEDMMSRRSVALEATSVQTETPASLDLGEIDALRPKLPRSVEFGGRRFRILEIDGELVAHSETCPHWHGPLGDCEVLDGCIVCPWHGYRFDPRTGRSTDGRKLKLAPAPRISVDPKTRRVCLTWPQAQARLP